ncbi:MAG: CoA-binding protein, partial [Dehalococcoidia bacterium]|nr:CoA-binding protein [Dehalococcoidia bacterium]
MSVVDQLKPFMEPQSVALIGVPRSSETGVNTVEFMLEYGYRGRLYPVNPAVDSVMGLTAYPTVKDIPDQVDLAVISVPRHIVPGIVEDCVQKGIKAIIIVSQGFADADREGKELQDRIVSLAREGGARIVGPNSMGTVNAFSHFSSAFVYMTPPQVSFPVGFASQSGLCINLGILGSQIGGHRFLGKTFDLGNACDVDFADVLEYFEADPEVQVIALHMEGIGDGRRFMEVARRVSRKKPIVAVKTGRTEQGGRVVASHTGALVGQDEVYQAAFDEAGIIRVRDLEELEDVVKAFFTLPLPTGNRVGVVTIAGGFGVMAVDACADLGLEMADLGPETIARLKPAFPSWLPPGNPVDIWPASYARPYREVYKDALGALLEDPGVDAVIGVLWLAELPRFENLDASEELLAAAEKYPQKPILAFSYGPSVRTGVIHLEASRRVASYPSMERAARALAAMWRYSKYRLREVSQLSQLPVNSVRAQAILSSAIKRNSYRLDAEGFDLLAAYSIDAPPSRVAGDEEEAVAAGRAVGYPLALKV